MELLVLALLAGGVWLAITQLRRRDPPEPARPATGAATRLPPAQPAPPLTGPGDGPRFRLHYRDANGEETNRTVTLHQVEARLVDGAAWPHTIFGWCHLREEPRHFAVSRIISLHEVSTDDQLTEPAAIRGLLRILSGQATAQDLRFEGQRALERAYDNALDLAEDQQPQVRLRWRPAGEKAQEKATTGTVLAYTTADRGSSAILARPLRGSGDGTWYFLDPQGTGVRHLLGVETNSGQVLEGKALADWVEALASREDGS